MSEFSPEQRIVLKSRDGLMELREYIPDDAEHIYNLVEFDRDHLRQFNEPTGDKYRSVEEARESIVNPVDPDKLRFGIWVYPEDLGEPTMVGSVNLTPIDTTERTAAIGWWVGKQHVGHGYAAKAASMLLKYAFENAELNMVFCKIDLGNTPSIKTAQKAGFRFRSSSEANIGTFVVTRHEYFQRQQHGEGSVE